MDASKLKVAQQFVSKYAARDAHLLTYKDDLVQEALMGVMAAQKKFDASRGAGLATVEWWYMRAYVSRFLKFRVLPHRVAQSSVEVGDDIDDALTNCPDGGTSLEETVQVKHDFEWFIRCELPKRVNKNFKAGEPRARAKAMALARIQGASLQEVGDQFGVSRERVRQITAKLGVNLE